MLRPSPERRKLVRQELCLLLTSVGVILYIVQYSTVQYSVQSQYSTCMRRWCGGAPPPRCPAACTWTPGTMIRVWFLNLD